MILCKLKRNKGVYVLYETIWYYARVDSISKDTVTLRYKDGFKETLSKSDSELLILEGPLSGTTIGMLFCIILFIFTNILTSNTEVHVTTSALLLLMCIIKSIDSIKNYY